MFIRNEIQPTDDEVILCVTYKRLLSWVIGILLVLLGFACIASPYYFMQSGKYARAIICPIGGAVLLVLGVEVLFTKHILFYKDRLEQVWHFVGERKIFYDRAKLVWASRLNGPRKGKTYLIKEVETSGRAPFLQVPIYYVAYFVSPDTEEQVDRVLSYLVGIENNSRVNEKRRLFDRATLPKGGL